MNEERYKLNILKDILKFSKRKLNKEEMDILLSSSLLKSKNYFTSAALLVKRGKITIEDFLSLQKLRKEQLANYLEPVDEDYNYFASITPEELYNALREMEEFIKNNPQEALENQLKNKERITKIKELNENNNEIKRGA